jgi:hypothetical protein
MLPAPTQLHRCYVAFVRSRVKTVSPSAHGIKSPMLNPRREEVAEAGAHPGLLSKPRGTFLDVDDDAHIPHGTCGGL